jgi:hypothetical protein
MVADPTAAGGQALRNANINAAKIAPALASPGSYFEVAFAADAGIAYHVWVRMQADGDSKSNDSVHMQFNDSLDAAGRPYAQIGTTSSAEFVLQAGPAGAAPRGWGWTENGWESAGPDVFFAADGSHVLRVQQREDGPTIDQIVLSPDAYLTTSPGARQSDTTVLEFTEDGSTPPPPSPSSAGTIVLWTAASVDTDRVGNWILAADSTAAGGATLWNLDAGAAKIAPALASPTTYFEVTFSATAGTAYHVWLRMRAEEDFWANDSVHIQFSDAVDSAGAPLARIGSASSAEFVLQDGPGGAAPQGWGWTDNGWGAAGSHVYFEATGSKTLRIQQREDGAIIDQIVLSPDAYLTSPPGSRRNDAVILAAQQP